MSGAPTLNSATGAVAWSCNTRVRPGLNPYIVLLGVMLMRGPEAVRAATARFSRHDMPTAHAAAFFGYLVDYSQTSPEWTLPELFAAIRRDSPQFASLAYDACGVPFDVLVHAPTEIVDALREYVDGRGSAVEEEVLVGALRDVMEELDEDDARRPAPESTGALARWRQRPTSSGPMFRAAALDASGIEVLNQGLHETAREYFRRAAREEADTGPKREVTASARRAAWEIRVRQRGAA